MKASTIRNRLQNAPCQTTRVLLLQLERFIHDTILFRRVRSPPHGGHSFTTSGQETHENTDEMYTMPIRLLTPTTNHVIMNMKIWRKFQ